MMIFTSLPKAFAQPAKGVCGFRESRKQSIAVQVTWGKTSLLAPLTDPLGQRSSGRSLLGDGVDFSSELMATARIRVEFLEAALRSGSEGAGCLSSHLAEAGAEMLGIGKSGIQCDLLDRQAGRQQ